MNTMPTDEAVIAAVDTALFGCEDGETLADDDCSIPVGEFRRLLHDVAKPRVEAILAENAPRVIRTAADIRALGEAVRDGEPDARVLLVEESASRSGAAWTIDTANGTPLMACDGMNGMRWLTAHVSDYGIAGCGPWRVAWSRGVDLP